MSLPQNDTPKKRTIDAFFGSSGATRKKETHESDDSNKKLRPSSSAPESEIQDSAVITTYTNHPTYPFPIEDLSPDIHREVPSLPCSIGRSITSEPDLDLLYFEPYLPPSTARALFRFLRSSLPFYRVEYDINRGGISTHIRTPRWTTVFGVDDTCRFGPSTSSSSSSLSSSDKPREDITNYTTSPSNSPSSQPPVIVVDAKTNRPVPLNKERFYSRYHPRPIPKCLDDLRRSTEAATGCAFNFCLVNYYASGSDSISYHSDDERFLGPEPAIASFSLGARRDFLLKHKPPPPSSAANQEEKKPSNNNNKPPLKFPLGSGDMVLMRGPTQSNWLHSIPKRSGKNTVNDGGRINITFRKAMVKAGSENYYHYNVGSGPVYRWDASSREMREWKAA